MVVAHDGYCQNIMQIRGGEMSGNDGIIAVVEGSSRRRNKEEEKCMESNGGAMSLVFVMVKV